MSDHKGRRRPAWRRGLKYTVWGVTVLSVAALAAGGILYYRLQPLNHFRHVGVVSSAGLTAAPGGASNTGGAGGGGSSSPQGTRVAATQRSQSPDTFNVLLLGSDQRTPNSPGHSDSIIIVHVDLRTHQYNMLSIPRDSRVYVKGFGYTKITSAMYLDQAKYGIQVGARDAIETISNFTGLPINYYAVTSYWGLRDIVDAVGGITMHIPFPVTVTLAWYGGDGGEHYAPGNYQLRGKMVTEIVHERMSLPNGDYGRQELQAEALIGIANKVLTHPTMVPAAIRQIPKYLIATNMTKADMLSLALAVRDFSMSQVHYYQVYGKSALIYNDPLQAKDDEILLNMAALHKTIQAHFE